MPSWRFRWEEKGAHVHVRVFVGPRIDTTHAKSGTLVMNHDEFVDFCRRFGNQRGVNFVEETRPDTHIRENTG